MGRCCSVIGGVNCRQKSCGPLRRSLPFTTGNHDVLFQQALVMARICGTCVLVAVGSAPLGCLVGYLARKRRQRYLQVSSARSQNQMSCVDEAEKQGRGYGRLDVATMD
jgi:hypothetical protein